MYAKLFHGKDNLSWKIKAPKSFTSVNVSEL